MIIEREVSREEVGDMTNIVSTYFFIDWDWSVDFGYTRQRYDGLTSREITFCFITMGWFKTHRWIDTPE
jgi:hypothetical protein